MPKILVSESARAEAPPAAVYAVLADYRVGHAAILPKMYTIRLEAGGTGAGTVVVLEGRMMGFTSTLRLHVTEPEPGRVLRETGPNVSTDFTVEPLDGGRASRVTIASTLEVAPGVRGWIEGKVMPRIMRRMFADELANLARYVQTNPGGSSGTSL